MGRRKYKSWRVKARPETIELLARELVPNHAALLAQGYVICATSGLWRTRRGTFTARLAYRTADRSTSIIHTVRGINLGSGDV